MGRSALVVIVLVFWVGMLLAAAIGTSVGWISGVGSNLRSSPVLGKLLLEMESTDAAAPIDGTPGQAAASSDRYVELFEGEATPPVQPAANSTIPPLQVMFSSWPKGISC